MNKISDRILKKFVELPLQNFLNELFLKSLDQSLLEFLKAFPQGFLTQILKKNPKEGDVLKKIRKQLPGDFFGEISEKVSISNFGFSGKTSGRIIEAIFERSIPSETFK